MSHCDMVADVRPPEQAEDDVRKAPVNIYKPNIQVLLFCVSDSGSIKNHNIGDYYILATKHTT